MREFVVDVSSVASFVDFIASFNDGFCRHVGGEWDGNLNAFHDYLSWPNDEHYRLVFRGWPACAAALAADKMWDGKSLLDILTEIFQDNPHVDVILT